MSEISKEASPFDFESHRKSAVEKYSKKRQVYEDLAFEIENILTQALEARTIKINAIQSRAKDEKSFGQKVMTPNQQNPEQPKYPNPMAEITDLAGVRVITFFPSVVGQVCLLVEQEFEVIEKVDHTATAEREERLGYLSIHYIVRFGGNRKTLSEYRKFDGLVAEIQVRTVLQHAL
jgi:ppGpp synthetase/RelA/SpoT-type nucleotidyltranferase